MALFTNSFLQKEARIADFNSGILGYFSDRFVMNSDGLVNQAAYDALKENRLWDLFKKNRIQYIVDYEIVLTYRYKPFFGIEDPIKKIKRVDMPNFINLAS